VKERTYWRDLTYHLFHRKDSAKRFMDEAMADVLRMRDIDCLEYCYACDRPVALVELKAGAERPVRMKPLIRLSEMADLPAFVVFYQRSLDPNPIYLGQKNLDGTTIRDIDQLTVLDLAKNSSRSMAPKEFFRWLLGLHLSCNCQAASNLRQWNGSNAHGWRRQTESCN